MLVISPPAALRHPPGSPFSAALLHAHHAPTSLASLSTFFTGRSLFAARGRLPAGPSEWAKISLHCHAVRKNPRPHPRRADPAMVPISRGAAATRAAVSPRRHRRRRRRRANRRSLQSARARAGAAGRKPPPRVHPTHLRPQRPTSATRPPRPRPPRSSPPERKRRAHQHLRHPRRSCHSQRRPPRQSRLLRHSPR